MDNKETRRLMLDELADFMERHGALLPASPLTLEAVRALAESALRAGSWTEALAFIHEQVDMLNKLKAEDNAAMQLVRAWMTAVLKRYPQNWAFDPTNPEEMIANIIVAAGADVGRSPAIIRTLTNQRGQAFAVYLSDGQKIGIQRDGGAAWLRIEPTPIVQEASEDERR